MKFEPLPKLRPGDSVGIVSPSFVAPAVFPLEYELGMSRLREQFGLNPVPLPNATNPNATNEDKASDLIEAFTNPDIKAVITTIGGDHQIEYVHRLPPEPFRNNPKPFFGYSDNSHLCNFLFRQGVPSFYGGCIYTEYAMQGSMDEMTSRYLRLALFDGGTVALDSSPDFNDEDLFWGKPELLSKRRRYQPNSGWHWDGEHDAKGVSWGGCLESIDELLRHNAPIPSLADFENIVLFLETSEERPSDGYVMRVLRALGERGILATVQGFLMGRPKAWNFEQPLTDSEKERYTETQRQAVLKTVRRYNPTMPIVQNLDFGHTAPSICLPYGAPIEVAATRKQIACSF